tara:strand:- start:1160 stop:1360 length:201 start_codon:yes stop_codon:yes gene_type:complete
MLGLFFSKKCIDTLSRRILILSGIIVHKKAFDFNVEKGSLIRKINWDKINNRHPIMSNITLNVVAF